MSELSDEELNSYVRARLSMLGIDLSVLPEEDEDAPADQKRILESAREFLRNTPPAISNFKIDRQKVPPAMYPSELVGRIGRDYDE